MSNEMATDEIRLLRGEVEELRRALAETQETIRAIRSGEVDALVVETHAGERVFTLESAYEPYRVFLENMQQGAASLSADGLILYANNRFGEILKAEGENLAGKSVYEVVESGSRGAIERLLKAIGGGPQDAEITIGAETGRPVHVLLHVTSAPDGSRCAVLTDLTERVRQHEILASREWLRVTLTSIGDAVLSCDTAGRVTFCNPVAELLTGWPEREALGQPIERIFRISDEITGKAGDNAAARALVEETVVSLGSHAVLVTRDGREIPVEDSAAPIRDAEGRVVGAVLVFHDATEKRRARRLLLESEAKLVGANRAKDDFLATLSHELRTPLNAILGWAHMISTRNVDARTMERGLQAIVRSAQAQARLVTDLLDVSRIVSGTLRLAPRPADLTGILFAALDAARPSAEAKRISLALSVSVTSATIEGDSDRLQQILWNLLSNAVKFTPEGGSVDVSLQQAASGFTIRVHDNGAGIEPEFLPHVFERFAQADTGDTRRQPGLGLGLSIARDLVHLHGGTMEVHSDGVGQGATFTVHLPFRPPQSSQAPDTSGPPALSSEQGQPGASLLSGIRVLVVDDEEDARDLLATIMTDYGGEAVVAASAADGLEQLRQAAFDVLLSDIGMPGRDGYDFIREVRSLPPGAGGKIPAAALTAYGGSDNAHRALSSGYQVHVAKPVLPATLAATVAWLAGRSGGSGGSRAADRPNLAS